MLAKTPKPDNSLISEIIKNTFLFSQLGHQTITEFASQAIYKSYPKGRILFLYEDHAEFFYVITKGWVKLFRETLDGGEVIIDILTQNHIFGETAIFDQDLYNYGAEIIDDNTTLLALPLSLLKQQLEKNPQLTKQMLQLMSKFRRQQDKELEHRDLQSAPQRIGCFLLRLCKPEQPGPIILHLPYDKMLLASRLGMKPETFSRALMRLKEETGIRIKGATIEIDHIEQLSHYSCNACTSSYPCQDLH